MSNIQGFQYLDRRSEIELLEEMNLLLSDSDAVKEKDLIKRHLKNISNTYNFIAIGNSRTGKSSLLNELFSHSLFNGNTYPTDCIKEYRFGEEEREFPIDSNIIRIFHNTEVLKGISIIDTPGCDILQNEKDQAALKNLLKKSDVLFVLFSCENVNSFAVWGFLEEVELRKVIFVVTMDDKVSDEKKKDSKIKLNKYMKDAGITAPIFHVVFSRDEVGTSNGLSVLKEYVEKNLLLTDPGLTKERKNILELKGTISEIHASFSKRKEQLDSDLKVVSRIDDAMNVFLQERKEKTEAVKQSIKVYIEQAVDEYENEIISRLDPGKIKERFPKGYDDFMVYLNYMNEGYRKRMTSEVNRRTQDAIKDYISGLEKVLDEAAGYFRDRESLLSLEDKFYGGLAKKRQSISVSATGKIHENEVFYDSLEKASEDLFMILWNERRKRDQKIGAARTAEKVVEAAAGVAVVTAIVSGTTVIGLWPFVATIAGAVLLSDIARKIASAKSDEELEKKTAEAINEFRLEVGRTKKMMTDQILSTIEAILISETDSSDRLFAEFRMNVNLEAQNLPKIEMILKKSDDLIEQIELSGIEGRL